MNLRNIKYFVAVAEELHFARAAERLHISQPPLSTSIRKLERDLGFSLFNRANRRVSLTDAGTAFYHEALRLLRQAETMQQVGQRVAQGATGRIHMGFPSSMLFSGLGEIIERYRRQYPKVSVSLVELNSSEQVSALQRQQIDLGFVHDYPDSPDINTRLFQSESFVCCLHRRHALAAASAVRVTDLKNDVFLMFPRSMSPYYYDRITAICVGAGFSPLIIHEVRSWITIVQMVGQGFGVALVPESLAKMEDKHTVYVRIASRKVSADTHCIWRKSSRSTLLRNFLDSVFRE